MKPWVLFGAGLAVAICGLGWVSSTLVQLEERALLSENSRLALWRMDLALARLISAESTRPATDYAAGLVTSSEVLVHFDVAPGAQARAVESGAEDRLDALRPFLATAPIAVVNNFTAGDFNRRNFFATNNMASADLRAPEAAMAPFWFGDALVLVRRVRLADGVHVQGARLNWDLLRSSLLREVKDLLPEAQLEPVNGKPQGDALMLASLPVRLVPGVPAKNSAPERPSIRWAIAAAWVSLALVALALGVLLFGSLALDKRRAAFVSAVTHELRTPLTTFKLYAELLEGRMVPEEKRQDYLRTLSQEANRLCYLVENVLAYAQIEKGRKRKPLEVLSASDLLEGIVPRLESRAQAALKLEPIPSVTVKADRVSVEQILFNLVDNACTYARVESRAAITIAFALTRDRLTISVSDEGPGVPPEVERVLFEPLRKSAAQAADGAQGIGLGLALSRRLARAMGGDLRYRKAKGATFELFLVRVTNA